MVILRERRDRRIYIRRGPQDDNNEFCQGLVRSISAYVNNNIYYNSMLPIDKCWVVLYNSYVNYDIFKVPAQAKRINPRCYLSCEGPLA